MSVATEELKLRLDSAGYDKEEPVKKAAQAFLPYFACLDLRSLKKTIAQKIEEEPKEHYSEFFKFCESNKLLQPYCLSTSDIILNSGEEGQDFFIQQKEHMLTGLVELFAQHIVHVREIQTFARQMANDKKEAEYNPESALKNTKDFIQKHFDKMKGYSHCDALNKALQLLPKTEADQCMVQFREEAIRVSAEINKLTHERVDRQFCWTN